MTIKEKEEEVIEEFSFFEDWMAKYEYIIDLGKNLNGYPPEQKTPENIIKGCQSQVWLHAYMDGEKLIYKADSDALISKGLISLLVGVLSDQTPADILSNKLKFIEEIGLNEHLSPNRSNGLSSMIKTMKAYAIAFSK